MSRATEFIVDSDEPAGSVDQYLGVEPDESLGLRQRRELEYRVLDQSPGAFDEVEVPGVSAAGCEAVTGRFALRVNDDDCLLEVRVRVFLDALNDDPPGQEGMFRSMGSVKCPDGYELRSTENAVRSKRRDWRRMIRRMWSRQYQIRALDPNCRCAAYDVDIDVEWVAEELRHHRVRVRSGCDPEHTNSTNWFMGMSDYTAAHEFGHLLGLDDEYTGSCVVTSVHSIMWGSDAMRAAGVTGVVQLFHYHLFAEWLSSNLGCRFEIGRIEDIPAFEEGGRFHSW